MACIFAAALVTACDWTEIWCHLPRQVHPYDCGVQGTFTVASLGITMKRRTGALAPGFRPVSKKFQVK